MFVKDLKGRPPVKGGDKTGYFLWEEDNGFHLMWMTKGEMHGFTGAITGEKLYLKQLVKIEANDKVEQPNFQTITWETRTQDDTDGIIFESTTDFTVELFIDSIRAGFERIFCGLTMRRPTSNPFVVTLK
ncbi:MAG: hypothetical protein EU536_03070 [Promethearchaeota archaeon]|nr:MAG: hypothetical protein EU536_03070 [Candidatus Lokiarchaeota archaeon]